MERGVEWVAAELCSWKACVRAIGGFQASSFEVVDAETFPDRAGQADVLAEERRRPALLGFRPRRRLTRAECAARRRGRLFR